jgi:hypothetical protein
MDEVPVETEGANPQELSPNEVKSTSQETSREAQTEVEKPTGVEPEIKELEKELSKQVPGHSEDAIKMPIASYPEPKNEGTPQPEAARYDKTYSKIAEDRYGKGPLAKHGEAVLNEALPFLQQLYEKYKKE